MSISVRCECGKQLGVASEHAGKKGRCPQCGVILTIPTADDGVSPYNVREEPPIRPAPTPVTPRQIPAARPIPSALAPAGGIRGRDRLYLVLLAAMIPLLIHTFAQRDDLASRLKHTFEANRQTFENMPEDASLDQLLNALPDHRVEGASLPRNTWAHWGFAAASAAVFFALTLAVLRSKDSRPKSMLIVGLFTGTLGVLLLLGVQWAAELSQGIWLRGSGIVTVLFYIVKFIGFSYRAADDPSNGFLLSFIGFTCGVGFCEELCKALPLLWHFRKHATLGWRGACVWGMVSGVGFGVAEGIMYSSQSYNGLASAGTYWVRFASCVGLHAVWAAAVGVSLFRNQHRIHGAESIGGIVGWSALIMAVPMLLHGLYDTLLKQGHDGWAVAAAVASFVWLAFQIEWAGRQEQRGTLEMV